MKQYDKIFIPSDKKPEFFEDWVLLLHGEPGKNYTCAAEEQPNANVWFEVDRFQLPIQEQPNVIVLTKNE